MVWYNLRIGSYVLKYQRIKIEAKKYPKCDEKGNLLNYVKGEFTTGFYENEKGEKVEQAFFLINGKPRDKLSKTKETDTYKEVNRIEVEDLLTEKEFLVECPKLHQDLIDSGKALKFGISFGGGGKHGSMKVSYAYIFPSELYKGFLFMSVGDGMKSEALKEMFESLTQAKKLKELNKAVVGIDTAKIEELITL